MPVVVVDVALQACPQCVDVIEVCEMEVLGLQSAKEALHSRVIEAISFSRHTLFHSVARQCRSVRLHAVVRLCHVIAAVA